MGLSEVGAEVMKDISHKTQTGFRPLIDQGNYFQHTGETEENKIEATPTFKLQPRHCAVSHSLKAKSDNIEFAVEICFIFCVNMELHDIGSLLLKPFLRDMGFNLWKGEICHILATRTEENFSFRSHATVHVLLVSSKWPGRRVWCNEKLY